MVENCFSLLISDTIKLTNQSCVMPFPPLPITKLYCDTITSYQLISWAIYATQWCARFLNNLDAKIIQCSPSLSLKILHHMLGIVEDIPRFHLLKEMQSERTTRFERMSFSGQSMTQKGVNSLRQGISLPVKGSLRMVCKLLRSLYRIDMRIYDRNPHTFTALKSILCNAETIMQKVDELKSNSKYSAQILRD